MHLAMPPLALQRLKQIRQEKRLLPLNASAFLPLFWRRGS